MNKEDFFRLYEMICCPNKFISENQKEVSQLCMLLELDKIPCVSNVLSDKHSTKNITPEEIIQFLETALNEYKILIVKNIQGGSRLKLEDVAQIREAKKRHVEEIFVTVLLMKLLRKKLIF